MEHTNLTLGADSPFVKSLQKTAIPLLGIGAIGLVAAAVLDIKHFFAAYLIGYIFFMGIAVTSLFFTTLQFLVNAGWATTLRRVPELIAGFIPIAAIGALPILIDVWGTHQMFHWTHAELFDPASPEYDPIMVGKQPFLNPAFFSARVVLYFVIWFLMYKFIVGNSFKQDATTDIAPTKKNWKRSAPFILLYALTFSFAGFDLLMSLDPHWFSTIFGIYFFAGNFVSTFAMITLFVLSLKKHGYLPHVNKAHYYDLGRGLFAFTVFWTYIAFSQYFLYWYGNLPEETLWYQHRLTHGWEFVSIALILVHFIIPFAMLLPQDNKKNPAIIKIAAIIVLVMQFVDLAWLIYPAMFPNTFALGWQAIAGFLFFAGLFLYIMAGQFKSKQLLPVNDPYLQESIELH